MDTSPEGWSVYALRLSDGTIYIGITQQLIRRVKEHQAGRGPTTVRMRLPAVLIWSETVPDVETARRVERWLKRGSRQEKDGYMLNHGCWHVSADA